MQEVYHDGTEGEPKEADTLEDLLPEIKKSLKKKRVAYVKLFIPSRKRNKKRG